ncbi:hypothetical protein [Flavobacterium agrisoli]|uniref:Uncharacterized protein n=1 Tax=Flavobacterium agrisoli TaxID=2793066 RepID=A0A934PJF2_9FLAO|nr:hypothetical protein [Flavobacterium agrisoli]MBK0369236.1 hypothetical protein [Flavobacterium agrisoli]
MQKNDLHTFHIPVMGLAFTIDSPIRVAQYGISSVIALADDDLIEKMNAFYCEKFQLPYQEISTKIADYRAKRITSYLNLVQTIVTKKYENLKTELVKNKTALDAYLEMLPDSATLKKNLHNWISESKESLQNYIDYHLRAGAIDVNIMTKLDKANFIKKEALPSKFNDAHAALRGFANSNLNSSVILSAGMNPRLFGYFAELDAFFPNEFGELTKKITLKVSDYRSALIQGNFLAKKGLWVSENRIESGLNCGGHAFATEGYLLGPILEEFKTKREELQNSVYELWCNALANKGKTIPEKPLPLKLTVQGGVGTAEEHQFLLDYYNMDSVGWGSPFLLVPEATSVDAATRRLLAQAQESDFYLSHISPLGVPFNTVKGTTNEWLKQQRINEQKAGSSCPKKFLALSKELGEQGVCTASKKYQDYKLSELEQSKNALSEVNYLQQKESITQKSCLCVGLANPSYLENGLEIKGQDQGVVVCPGPNLAYFDKEVSLPDMVQHIYGRKSVLHNENRPHFFIKELKLYLHYFQNEIVLKSALDHPKELNKILLFKNHVLKGIAYYENLMNTISYFKNDKKRIQGQLAEVKRALIELC